ncbi:EamA/RhaT family transporter [Phyllobacterium brassicacearum]|uniref:EamA/RhaT family transporter n=1 Tax=Phyllobacterium brassicacearum TaxID=314235 RepID=A0A2P7BU88_9HYPH|nr:DMT family transporter [Phyllobacterium brassicacearum]PSH70027.1 EamA/RhaT family transporter [Phyllobacterium brassicacearum]TDQ35085.1 EamA domain-containing membrane protein RarD [Phyllobacterium brassicacearum]
MVALAQDYKKSNSIGAGYAGALVTVFIWATWIIATRHSSGTHLGTIDLGLIRYGVPALVLAPVWLRTGLVPRDVPLVLLAIMVCGAGAVFFQFTTFAIHSTPAAAVGVLLGGSMPLAAALIGVLLFGERPDVMRCLGLAAIVAGLVILLALALGRHEISWISFVFLPLGALLWAGYTHAFKRSGLTALQGGALIAVWSFIIHAGLALAFGTTIFEVPLPEIGLQFLSQGVLSGLAAMLAYGIAVRSLGGSQAAAFSALTPVLAAFGGSIFLDEPVSVWEIKAAVITGLGVALSTGILSHRLKG